MGHCVLHADSAASAPFHEVTLFDNTDYKEYEANIFAAELLLPDEQVLALLNDDLFFFDVAKKLCVPFEMLDFKFRVLKRKGYKVESPVVSQGDFLKKLEKAADKAASYELC
ncbi:ImmA/IrrE family metallo-endopeptidase [Eubacterium sp. An11]|uniref:ImmA/IrrE family metallo-endopeptidase n=1 Tax=Eubacterium sp. An11 TaxID=1965542 RepID=UPI001FA86109|nr:ImmA/IrrE family metallo-endopeptidase [Eubacterium sp. An11]